MGTVLYEHIRGCIKNFPDWPPGVRPAIGTALCHWVQLHHYFVSQSSEFCRHNPLCCLSTNNNTKGKRVFRHDSVQKLLDTLSCVCVCMALGSVINNCHHE
jgi:hypothetical protein